LRLHKIANDRGMGEQEIISVLELAYRQGYLLTHRLITANVVSLLGITVGFMIYFLIKISLPSTITS
jgi:hypothetical protein